MTPHVRSWTAPWILAGLLTLDACHARDDARVIPDSGLPAAASGALMFVTQVPVCAFGTTTSTFGNHRGGAAYARRGGDLYIHYADGTYDASMYPNGLRNLTREAGFGESDFQGASSIAVRDPALHWTGEKAMFSMAVGGAVDRYGVADAVFQLYEITGFGATQTPTISKVANQPDGFNNVSPFYGTDDSILFVSDRPRNGLAHLAPLLDEYELNPIVQGIYRLRSDASLELVEDSPSGSFTPFIDAYGRVIFTKWDHLRVDGFGPLGGIPKGGINFTSEAAGASALPGAGVDYFPERPNAPGSEFMDAYGRLTHTHDFNQFMPWEMHEDGSREETQNHVGRHELGGSFNQPTFLSDPSLSYLNPISGLLANSNQMASSAGLFDIRQDPVSLEYCGVYAPEFSRASAGQIVCYAAPPGANPEQIALRVRTSSSLNAPEQGLFRNPIRTNDGDFFAAHTTIGPQTHPADSVNDCVEGFGAATRDPDGIDRTALTTNYDFRIRQLAQTGDSLAPGAAITSGINADIVWFDGSGARRTYSGPLWEIQPVEVHARARPSTLVATIDPPEASVLATVLGPHGLSVDDLVAWMRARDLALIVTRNVTTRDRADRGQPFNLAVDLPGGVSTFGNSGTVYSLRSLQLFQGDRVRGYDATMSAQVPQSAVAGRRAIAVPLHDAPSALNAYDGAEGVVPLAADGSAAAFVPAGRALTWQTVGADSRPVVRERNWIDFAPGEIRTCPSCHGVNSLDQAGQPAPQNEPEALRSLLERWVAAMP